MEFSAEAIAAAQNGLQHLRNQVRTLMDAAKASEADAGYQFKFRDSINNDLNMPQALAVVQDLLKSDLLPDIKLATVFDFDQVLGLDLEQSAAGQSLPDEIQSLVEARRRAREAKQWDLSDQLRDEIQSKGYIVQDTSQGIKVYKP